MRSYVQSFPYYRLADRIWKVCELEGVAFERVGATANEQEVEQESDIGGDDANE